MLSINSAIDVSLEGICGEFLDPTTCQGKSSIQTNDMTVLSDLGDGLGKFLKIIISQEVLTMVEMY